MEALRDIIDEVILALGPLVGAANEAKDNDPKKLLDLLADLGWTPGSVPQPLIDLATAGMDLINTIGSDPEEISPDQAISSVKSLIDAINAIRNKPDDISPSGIDVTSFKATIGRDLLDYILVEHLLRNRYQIGGVLKLAGLIRLVETPAVGLRQAYLKRVIDWLRIGELFTDPVKGFYEAFEWNLATPKLIQAIGNVASLLDSYGLRLYYFEPQGDLLTFINAGSTAPPDEPLGFDLLIDDTLGAPDGVSAGVQLIVLPPTASRGAGIAILPYARLDGAQEIALSDTLSLSIHGKADFSKGIAITLAPGQPPEVQTGFMGGPAAGPAELQIGLKIVPLPGEPERRLIGTADATRVSLKTAGFYVGAKFLSGGEFDVFVAIELENARVVIKPAPDESDSFLTSILGEDGVSAEFSLGMQLSSLTGFHLTGSGGLEVMLPLHLKLGPIEFQAISLGLKTPADDEVELQVGATVSGELGPIAFTIQGAGFRFPAKFLDPPNGNLGPVDLDFAFLPPTGVGLAVDAEGLIGGGFLDIDDVNKRYSGILALAFGEISITAIGLIETKMPDGSNKYSMLINICIVFNPPINLSYGFTLSGVGGLVGVNRTMNTEALQRGIKNRSLDTILFPEPEWVILNASKIISDMRTIFPACEGRFVIGPMLKIGWGIPNVITGELGVFIELPFDPVRIAIMGQMNAAFPDDEFGILVINLDMLGVINSEKQELSLQASLFDSGIMSSPNPFKISGDAAMLLTWGNSPDFALSVGGFHPKFDPPPPDYIFCDLRRMQLVITFYVVIKVDCQGYVALTANSLQFGASIEVYVKELGFEIGGGTSFDALIYFSPFSFEFSISGYMWVKAQGVSLLDIYVGAELSGPNPWAVSGKAKFQILFFDVTVPFSLCWGDPQKAIPASVDPLPLFKDALAKPGNWSSRLPQGRGMAEQLRPIGEAEDTPDIVIVHPSGRLELRQNVAPCNITLEKFGNAPVAGHDRFEIDGLQAGELKLPTEFVKEYFARGQFEELSKAQKLSLPSFEKMDGGVTTAASDAIRFADNVDWKKLTYEAILINPDRTSAQVSINAPLPWNRAQGLMAGGAARLSEKNRGANTNFKIRNGKAKVIIEAQRYCIVDAVDLLPIQLLDGGGMKNIFDSRTEADQALGKERSLRPGHGTELLVIAECEVPASEVVL